MKKLMTSTIILLPLLILAIMLVSGAIMSLITHIYVEAVEFVQNGTLVLVMDDESAPPTKQLEVNVFPLKAENRDLVYTVEDESVVTVDESGAVTAQYFGETYITVTSAENKAAVDQLRVLVTDTSVHKVVMNGGYKTDLYEGEQEERTQALSVTVYPKEAENKSIEWTSSNEDVLHVSANGTVTLRGAGKATVKAISVDNPEAFASVEITCHKKIESIEIERKRVFTALAEAQFPQITKNPADADVKIAYTSSDDSIAKVDKAGNITFQKPGQVTVTATATDFGGKTAEVSNDYVSTLGYYRAPLFDTKQFTVDYDEYNNQSKTLPIPFAPNLENTYRKVEKIVYSTEDVLTFDEKQEAFTFTGAMPAGVKTLTTTVTATGYDTTTNELVSLVDAFTLTVLRNAQSVAVAYKGTGDANSIVLAGKSLSFGTENAAAAVKVSPANHTNTVVYSLEGENDVATLTGGTLTFQKAGSVTVKITCLDEKGMERVTKRVSVRYAPAAKEDHKKGVEITEPQQGEEPEKQQVLLSMNDDNHKEEAVIYFTEPAGTQVTYEVTEGKGEVIDLKEEDGVRHIIPKKGGFATVQITVTKSASPAGIALFAARASEETTVYTVYVYVDKPITTDSFEVELGGKPCESIFDTKLDEVPFTVKAQSPNGELEGKLFYISSETTNKTADADGVLQFSDAISFGKDLSALTVTFGVKYSDKAISIGASGELAFVTRTLRRNADSIEVSYKGTPVSAEEKGEFNTTSKTLTFTTDAESAANRANVKIEPATYTEDITYSLVGEGDGGNATLSTDGVLTFKREEACSVTVRIELQTADGMPTLSTEIVVHYNPRSSEEKAVELPDGDKAHMVLLMSDTATDKAKIDFNKPADSEVEYKVSEGEVIALEEANNEQTIVPKKGGFATVTVTVTASDGTETVYTIYVYVDRAVTKEDFKITFGEGEGETASEANTVFGTTLESVPFKVELKCKEGAMQGKRLYIRYGTTAAKAIDDETTFAEKITFSEELGTLNVFFGVEYTEKTADYKPEEGLQFVSRTLERNASNITVKYGEVETNTIVFGSESISVTEHNSLTLGEGNAAVSVTISPATHTDKLTYSLAGANGENVGENDIATLLSGKLTFKKAGTVTVVLQVKRGEAVTLEEKFTVTYAPIGANIAVELGEDEVTDLTLPFGGATKEGVIYFTAPLGAEVEYKVKDDADAVTLNQDENGLYHIVPKKGGFATVEVTVDGKTTYTVNVYVDKLVSINDFTVQFNNKIYGLNQPFLTSLNSLEWSVEVQDNGGSLAGKTVYISVSNGNTEELEEGAYSKQGSIDFGQYTTLTFTFGVRYTEKAQACGASGDLVSTTRKVETTHGNLSTAPTVTYNDGADKTLQAGDNNITLGDVGDAVVFKIAKAQTFSPSDFALTAEKVSVEGQSSFAPVISDDGDFITITLKSTQYVENERLTLTIGGHSYRLVVTVHAKAQTVSVSFDGKPLDEQTDYQTLLGSLTFTVTLGREDNAPIFNRDVQWKLNGDWQTVKNTGISANSVSVTVNGILSGRNTIDFRAADGAAGAKTFTLRLEQVAITQYTLALSVQNSQGDTQNLQEAIAITGNNHFTFPLSSDMQGTITLSVTMDTQGLLGGFGDEKQFKELFPVNLSSVKWGLDYDADNGQIHLENVLGTFHHEIYLEAGVYTVTLEFSRIKLTSIGFTGFDSKTDNYRGYQQVRVFAKQSTYSGTDVDYFRMPVAAISDVDSDPSSDVIPLLSWKLTRQNDSGSGEPSTKIASQVGNTVTYGNAKYSVVETADGKYELQDEGGNPVVGADGKYTGSTRVTWVDAFSEAAEGNVRIYFGDFAGLSETDVQNDYFGNFGEQQNWNPAETHEDNYDKSGRNFKPSDGAFSFLRIEGGDGAQNGVNCHFNFNILEGADLYNIFDAAGYLSHKKIVLHNNLYGAGEVEKVETPGKDYNADQFFSQDYHFTSGNWASEKVQFEKDLIYGNGYQVNLQAVNDGMDTSTWPPDPKYSQTPDTNPGMLNSGLENTAYGFNFGRLYNVTVKGTNANTKITPATNRMLFRLGGAYYSTLQNYSKLNPSGTNLYLKNTVMRYVANCAVQVWKGTNSLYFENVVIDECLRAVSLEEGSKVQFYFKGFTDVLNYCSAMGMQQGFRLINGGGTYAMYFDEEGYPGMMPGLTSCEAKEYIEWFGSNAKKGTKNYRYYANMVVTGGFATAAQRSTKQSKYWNDASSGYVDTQPSEQVGINFVDAFVGTIDEIPGRDPMMMGTDFSTYATKAEVDGGSKTFDSRDTNLLFTNARYIRLLCEYVDIEDDGTLIKNTEHIQWHMNKVYRERSIIGDETDHIKALKHSIQTAIDSGWDGVWPDGTTAQDALKVSPEAAALSEMLSETVLPAKYTY